MSWNDFPIDAVLRAVLLVAAGWILGRLARRATGMIPAEAFSPNVRMLMQRASFYLVFGLFALMAVQQAGFNLTVLLGAAGILSVAVGFASQTSASTTESQSNTRLL